MTRSFFHVPAALMDSSSVRRRSLQDEREELQRRPNRFHDMVPREFMLVGVAYTVRFLGKGESVRRQGCLKETGRKRKRRTVLNVLVSSVCVMFVVQLTR